jgi:signal transduction histidine kinase
LNQLIRITNYNAAWGRVLSASFLFLLLVAGYVLLDLPSLFWNALRQVAFHWSIIASIVVLLAFLAFCLLAFRNVVFWLELGSAIRLRTVRGVRTFRWAEVAAFEVGAGYGVGAGRELRLCLSKGPKLTVKVNRREEARVLDLLARYERAVAQRDAGPGAMERILSVEVPLPLGPEELVERAVERVVETAAQAQADRPGKPPPHSPPSKG